MTFLFSYSIICIDLTFLLSLNKYVCKHILREVNWIQEIALFLDPKNPPIFQKGYLKINGYANKSRNLERLKRRITNEIRTSLYTVFKFKSPCIWKSGLLTMVPLNAQHFHVIKIPLLGTLGKQA